MADAAKTDLARTVAWRASLRASRRYARSGNPLYAWEAAAIALAAGMPLPAAVLDYVVRVAGRLGAPQERHVAKPQAHVAACLEIAGPGPSAFERRRRFERDLLIMQIANRARANEGLLRGDALARAAASAHVDPDSVARQARRRTNPP